MEELRTTETTETENSQFRTEDVNFINTCIGEMYPQLEQILQRIEYMQDQVRNKVSSSQGRLRKDSLRLQEYERQLNFLAEKHQIIAELMNKQKAFDFRYP